MQTRPGKIIFDSTFLIAAFDRKDARHEECLLKLRMLAKDGVDLLVTWYKFNEVSKHVRALSDKTAFSCLMLFREALSFVLLPEFYEEESMRDYLMWNIDDPVSLCDVINYRLTITMNEKIPIATLNIAHYRDLFALDVVALD